ncbi:hypothetical protein N9189_03970 [Pirellulaceae bacterium]|nr:hypothetical protein [Pirellulaceae bacterium]
MAEFGVAEFGVAEFNAAEFNAASTGVVDHKTNATEPRLMAPSVEIASPSY